MSKVKSEKEVGLLLSYRWEISHREHREKYRVLNKLRKLCILSVFSVAKNFFAPLRLCGRFRPRLESVQCADREPDQGGDGVVAAVEPLADVDHQQPDDR